MPSSTAISRASRQSSRVLSGGGPDVGAKYVGAEGKRREDPQLLTGRGGYVDDRAAAGWPDAPPPARLSPRGHPPEPTPPRADPRDPAGSRARPPRRGRLLRVRGPRLAAPAAPARRGAAPAAPGPRGGPAAGRRSRARAPRA